MPLLSIVLQRSNSGKHPVNLFGSIQKQRIILESYSIKVGDGADAKYKYNVKLPFLTNYDINTNSVIQGTIPLFNESFYDLSENPSVIVLSQFTYRQCNYHFNLSRHLNESFSDFEIYDEDGSIYTEHYVITLNFTYGLEELI
jgi:hypothetical protein